LGKRQEVVHKIRVGLDASTTSRFVTFLGALDVLRCFVMDFVIPPRPSALEIATESRDIFNLDRAA
jgi:hypothetical protein